MEVRASSIEGRGLFAAAPIGQDEVAVRLGGRIVDTAALDRLIAATEIDPTLPYVDTITVHPDEHLVLPLGVTRAFRQPQLRPDLVVRRPLRARRPPRPRSG